jgi:peptidoglycan-associated lipoprotein
VYLKEELMKKVATIVAAPLLRLAVACGSDKKPAPVAPAATTEPPAVTSAPATPSNSAVNVDDAITKACKLKFADTSQSPKFDFDSEQLSPAEKDILEQIAKCLTTGPLKGRSVDLVGRADPRGETEYNMTLGAKRSRAAHQFLASAGVANDHLFDTSRGELDASGKDEEGWRKDRRVDVRLRN